MSTYVIYTASNLMSQMAMELEQCVLRDDETVYSPKIERIKRIKGQDKPIISYMFPGYLFIETENQEDLYLRIRSAMGKSIFQYCMLLRDDDYILPLSVEEEQRINLLGGDEHLIRNSVGFIEGEQLIVTEGPLKDMTGYVKKIDRHKKTALLQIPFIGEMREIFVGLEVTNRLNNS